MAKFNYYADPGHGWVRVPKMLLKKLKIEDEISSSSYMRGEWAYLEEDSDLEKFERKMISVGKEVAFKECHTDRQSRIRSYENYCIK